MARIEWPNPTSIATATNEGQTVPCSHPSALSENERFSGSGAGGIWPPRTEIVSTHQTMRITTMIVVTAMIRRASRLDS